MSDAPFLVPQIETDELVSVEISDREWASLEEALRRQLDETQRAQLGDAIAFFIHMVRLKDLLPTPRQYRKELGAYIRRIEEATKSLGALIAPEGSADTTSYRPVASSSDHIRFLLHRAFPGEMSQAFFTLHRLLRACRSLRLAVKYEQSGEHSKGRDGQYELKILLRETLLVARRAGDDLRLPAHSISDIEDATVTDTHPAYEFVMEVLALIDSSAPSLIAEKVEDVEERALTLNRISTYVRKSPGALNELLYEMRTDVESDYGA